MDVCGIWTVEDYDWVEWLKSSLFYEEVDKCSWDWDC